MREIYESGPVRVDLAGGTLDLHPLNLIIPDVYTLNLATSLKASVYLKETREESVVIFSKDYQKSYTFFPSDFTCENLRSGLFEEMTFIAWILFNFKVIDHLHIELSSGSPAGAGLGGSSAMGITLYKALKRYQGEELEGELQKHQAVSDVNAMEARILESGPAGYQDYYPALYGGVLALSPELGRVKVEQLYSLELKTFLEDHLTLIYSGKARLSGINNWEVYKAFFDGDELVRRGLEEIALVTKELYQALERRDFTQILDLIAREGECRKNLFPNIVPREIEVLLNDLKAQGLAQGMKMCGAGGGGCFLIIHGKGARERLLPHVKAATMEVLKFEVEQPL